MDKKTEALKLALEYLRDNQHYIADNERHAYVMEYNAFVERLEALVEQPAQRQKEGYASPGGGYVPAIPRPMPLDWKLVPRKATPEMLKAMDECAQEGYDERLYAGMASSVYMAAWDASPVMGTLPEQPAQQQELDELTAQRDKLADILTRTANALKGPPAELSLHSWHDLPEVAQQLKAVQQQEPVVWMYVNKSTHETKFQKHMRDFVDHSLWSEVPLYGEPLANHELQCVCGAVWLGDEMVHLPDKRPPAQQEPVAWKDEQGNVRMTLDAGEIQSSVGYVYSVHGERIKNACIRSDIPNGTPLYTSPPIEATPLASQRSVKPWVGLTDEEMLEVVHYSQLDNARAIQAKLKEKNNG